MSNLQNEDTTLDNDALIEAVRESAAIRGARTYIADGTMYLHATGTVGVRVRTLPPAASGSTSKGDPYRTYRRSDVYATKRGTYVVHAKRSNNWGSEDDYSVRSYQDWEGLWRAAEDDDSLLEALESNWDALRALPIVD